MKDMITRSMNTLKALALFTGCALVFSSLGGQAQAFENIPEIDPGSMASALTLLTGGLLVLTGRRRRK